MLEYEEKAREGGAEFIAGIDEAGRGPLAGPVVIAGVIMPLDDIIEGVDDSKKLTAKKREELYGKIIAKAIEYTVSVIDQNKIDEINILAATKKGMRECIEGFRQVDVALIDAVKLDLPIKTVSIVHGDALSYSIAAASIVAKVTRDRMMAEYDKQFPEYGFAKHKGYGTAEHIEKIEALGPCPLHRQSFIGHFVKKP